MADVRSPTYNSPVSDVAADLAFLETLRAMRARQEYVKEDLCQPIVLERCWRRCDVVFWRSTGCSRRRSDRPTSLPLNGAGRLAGDVVDDAVDAADLVDDAGGGAGE